MRGIITNLLNQHVGRCPQSAVNFLNLLLPTSILRRLSSLSAIQHHSGKFAFIQYIVCTPSVPALTIVTWRHYVVHYRGRRQGDRNFRRELLLGVWEEQTGCVPSRKYIFLERSSGDILKAVTRVKTNCRWANEKRVIL